MKQILSDLLFYPFDCDLVDPIDYKLNALFINCLPEANLNNFAKIDVLNFYAHEEKKWKSVQSASLIKKVESKYHNIFCALPKNKIELHYFIALAAKHLEKDGRVIFTASNDLGGKNLSKWMKQYGFIGDDFSKKKSRIFVGKLEDANQHAVDKAYKDGSVQEIAVDDYVLSSQAGVFGWNKVDQGSKLLIDALEGELSGVGADFGCGYGYLSHAVLSQHRNIKKLYALDVDQRAVMCTEMNLKEFDCDVSYHWADLTKTFPFKEKLNWIVMNPPFHEDKARKDNLGQAMIESAYSSLGKTGTLYMVANKHLPYEKTLSIFSSVEKIKEENGFKVFKAIK